MRKRLLGIVISTVLCSFASCEDVVEVDLSSVSPRLIIDAIIRVDTTQPSTPVTIKVRETNSFFEAIPPAGLQQITIANLDTDGQFVVLIEEEPNSGIYSAEVGTSFLTEGLLFLQIDFEDEFYVAYTNFVPTVPINNLGQGETITTFGEEQTEVIISFTDSNERDDFYLFDFDFGNFLVTEDEFYQGQDFEFSYFYDQELDAGEEIEVSILGVNEEFYDYMDLLLEQSEGGFGIFETPAVTVRGNFINATTIDNIENFNNVNTPDNYGLGYFAVVQEYKQTLTIQ